MPMFTEPPPLSLYIHLPWCVRKCPYCDFNSHEMTSSLPEELYTAALLQQLKSDLPLIAERPLTSIFFGGGTPSLFSAQAIEKILNEITKLTLLTNDIEITLEANPGTIDYHKFKQFYDAGINRLSLGIQSLQNDKLKKLGRIHDCDQALKAIEIAINAGFTNFNLDFMFGLPNQTIEDALTDLHTALSFQPTHLSWYQLTIEPNTVFYKKKPPLPSDDLIWQMQLAGQQLLAEKGFQQYEVSAYSRSSALQCRHNLHYWEFGDYLGIGAGAHSKITDLGNQQVKRFAQAKQPRDYMDANKRKPYHLTHLAEHDLIFEFMLNALRLKKGVPLSLFTKRTGLALDKITSLLNTAKERKFLEEDASYLRPSSLGYRYLNDLVEMFL